MPVKVGSMVSSSLLNVFSAELSTEQPQPHLGLSRFWLWVEALTFCRACSLMVSTEIFSVDASDVAEAQFIVLMQKQSVGAMAQLWQQGFYVLFCLLHHTSRYTVTLFFVILMRVKINSEAQLRGFWWGCQTLFHTDRLGFKCEYAADFGVRLGLYFMMIQRTMSCLIQQQYMGRTCSCLCITVPVVYSQIVYKVAPSKNMGKDPF